MWPMLDGLNPLLGNAPFGFFVANGKPPQIWQRWPHGTMAAASAPVMIAPTFGLMTSAPRWRFNWANYSSSGE